MSLTAPSVGAVATTYLPTPKDVKEQLAGLLGRDVSLSPTTPMSPGSAEAKTVAVYVDDRLGVRAVIACDLAFSAYAGAAIGLVPPSGAEAAIEAKGLDETLSENLYEVLNVMAAVFNAEGAVHVKLRDVHPSGTRIPPAVHIRLVPLGRREDFRVDIAGYGSGLFSVVVCA